MISISRRGLLAAAAFLPLSLAAAGACAADAGPLAELKAFLAKTPQASGTFSQTVVDKNGREAAKPSSGTFRFLRPGRFEWVYEKPYVQRIVSDGNKVWIYDPDLAQVTVKTLSQALPATPAAILFGKGDLEQDWLLTEYPPHTVAAKPRKGDAGFESVEMTFSSAGELSSMKMTDSFGQVTSLSFGPIDRSPVDASSFNFRIPKGADVIEDSGIR
jgi:outer membrane lipoprotein carrier protein